VSYGAAAALQAAIYGRLTGHAALTDLVGDAIFDAIPAGAVPDLYVALGPERARDRSDMTGRGARHDITIAVVSQAAGFAEAKAAAAAVSDALVDADLALARGSVVSLRFERARAVRSGKNDERQIALTFRVRVDDGA